MTGSSENTINYLPKNTLNLIPDLGFKILYRPIIAAPAEFRSGGLLPIFPRRFPRYFSY